VAVRLAAAQAGLGHQVELVAYSEQADFQRVERQMAGVPHRSEVAVHTVPDPDRVERLLARRAGRLLGARCRGADFVHLHGVWDPILKRAATVARRTDVPYCFRPAGMLDPWSLSQKRWKKRLALALGYRAALQGAAFIHTLNDDERRLIQPLALGVRLVVLPNGVFLEEIQPPPVAGTFRAAHPELGPDPYVLFLSRLHYKKGLDLLAQAFALLVRDVPRARLVVAGPPDGAEQDFQARIAAAGLTGRVHLVGPLYGPDKLAAMVDAACFCLPSRQEGFSVAITEALACGLPVVVSEACHFPEVAEAGAGAVVPLEPPAIAAALCSVLTDARRARAQGQAGAALVRSRYTWPGIAEATVAAYEEARAARG
jgi:glycosyltransferase involved in cell wall biosynthesis